MEMKNSRKYRKLVYLAASCLAMWSGVSYSAEFWMCADEQTITMPDSVVVPMWAYAQDDNDDLSDGCGNPATIPGPELVIPPGDNLLTIHLKNNLPDPVSIVVHGQAANMTPVFFMDAQNRRRVRSITHETASGATGNYTWTNFKPGTFLYQSGTHPAVQVQMGLYGAAIKKEAPGLAYPGVSYDNELTILYSEIDPALHAAVDTQTYGTPAYSSTQNYQPKYFLVNGQPFDPSISDALTAGFVGETTLVRFINSGLQMRTPMFNGLYMSLVAEDGNLYPYPREQYSVMLAAGKTRDAIIDATKIEIEFVSLYDRHLQLSNGSATGPGGHQSILNFGSSYIISHDTWTLISLPNSPGAANTVADIFAGVLNASELGTSWSIYAFNSETNTSHSLSSGSIMQQGDGYWMHQTTGGDVVLKLGGNQPPRTVDPACPSVDGCFEIELTPPAISKSTGWNLIGHPFPKPVDWADVRLLINTGTGPQVCTPSEAAAKNLLLNSLAYFNGSPNYQINNTAMEPYKGYWLKLLGGAVGSVGTTKLLVPMGELTTSTTSCTL